MWQLVKQSILKRKVNSISVMLSVALAVMSAVTLGVVYGGVSAGVQLNEQRAGAQIVVVSSEAANEITSSELLFTGAPAPIYFDKSVAEKLMSQDGVARATTQFYGQTLDESCCSTSAATRLIGIDFATDWTVSSFAHASFANGLGDKQVVVGGGTEFKPGDVVSVLGVVYTVADVLDMTGTELDTAILMDIDVVRSISAGQEVFAHYWETYGNPSDIVSAVLIDIDESVIPLDRALNRINSTKGVTALQRSEVVAESRESLTALFGVMLGVGLLLIASCVVQLFARFYSCVWEHKTELALYRAIGASTRDLRRLICAEMAVLLGVGVVVGVLLGLIFQAFLIEGLTAATAFPYVAMGVGGTAGVVLAVAAFFALVGALSVAWPLRQVERLQPSVAMQQADID